MKTTSCTNKSRRAFSLVEILVVMGVLAVFFTVATGAFVGIQRTYHADQAAQRRLVAQNTLADLFRGDVAVAIAAPKERDDIEAGPQCLILELSAHEWIVYEMGENHVERRLFKKGAETKQSWPAPGEGVHIEFRRDAPEGRLLSLRWKEKRRPSNVERVWDFAAALGGDVR
jgi:prepilin-type N-terminal cleavage/methylation domain-containing protein